MSPKLLPLAMLPLAWAAPQTPIKSVPPAGIEIAAADRAELQAGLDRLRAATSKLAKNPLLPDVLIYQEAVRYALEYNEFFKADEVAKARLLLQHGRRARRRISRKGARLGPPRRAWWSAATSRRSIAACSLMGWWFRRRIRPRAPHRWRLDAWFHGRNETLSEVNFLADREKNMGEWYAARHHRAASLRPLLQRQQVRGRGGLLRSARRREAPISPSTRTAFSIAASAWAARRRGISARTHAGMWAAVAPGAGFSETVAISEAQTHWRCRAAWWEQKLFHLYDATDYAVNLYNTATWRTTARSIRRSRRPT